MLALVRAPRWLPPAGDKAAAGRTFQVAIFEDPSARNFWSRRGPNNSIWNPYVAAGSHPVLFTYTSHDDWVPDLAEDIPSPVRYDESLRLWRSTVHLRRSAVWTDGT